MSNLETSRRSGSAIAPPGTFRARSARETKCRLPTISFALSNSARHLDPTSSRRRGQRSASKRFELSAKACMHLVSSHSRPHFRSTSSCCAGCDGNSLPGFTGTGDVGDVRDEIILATHEAAANAIEHARTGTEVTVRAVRDADKVMVVVTNSWRVETTTFLGRDAGTRPDSHEATHVRPRDSGEVATHGCPHAEGSLGVSGTRLAQTSLAVDERLVRAKNGQNPGHTFRRVKCARFGRLRAAGLAASTTPAAARGEQRQPGLVVATSVAQLTREPIPSRHDVVWCDRHSESVLRSISMRHRFSAPSTGKKFSMRFVFALYLCIVALGLICGIAASVA